MPSRFYLSTRKDRSAQAALLLEALKANGWERTLDWADENDRGPDGYADTALAEIAAVREADVLVVAAARRLRYARRDRGRPCANTTVLEITKLM
jgi:hypothetical protein